jgi:hypothetical protein
MFIVGNVMFLCALFLVRCLCILGQLPNEVPAWKGVIHKVYTGHT